jgi:hypothetical protein
MSDSEIHTDELKRLELLAEIDRLESELRRRLLALVEHPGVSEEFKGHDVVKEWIK